jgi:nucleotide-binding universal stress UspA family protein
MYRSLLVPLDGSAFAEHALPLALAIARRAGAALTVVQVHVPFALMDAERPSPGGYEAEAEARVLERERAYLDGVVKRVASLAPVPVTPALVEGPVVAELLSGQAAVANADLVVMASHGRGPLSRFWLGSVADEMVRRATTPLLLVRPQEAAPAWTADPVLRHLVVPLDGSALAEQVLESAIGLGRVMQAGYTLVRIYGPLVDAGLDPLGYATVGGFEPSDERLRAEATDYLNRVAGRLQQQGFNVQTHAAPAQSPASAILDAAQRLGVDLIALETHGRRGLLRLLLGSVADKVIRGASTPVLVHRPPRPENRP